MWLGRRGRCTRNVTWKAWEVHTARQRHLFKPALHVRDARALEPGSCACLLKLRDCGLFMLGLPLKLLLQLFI